MKLVRTAVAVLLLVSASAAVQAGRTNYFETFVDPVARVAYGSFVDARRSADNVQYIACDVHSRVGEDPAVSCVARSTTAGPVSCMSRRPELVAVAQALTDEGYVRFECEGNDMKYLYISKGSLWLP